MEPRSETLRQALLDAGLGLRAIKERLARHKLDGAAPAASVPRPLWEELVREQQAPAPAPADPRAPLAARLERTRLLLLRAALRVEPYEALPVPPAAASSASGLRLYLGLVPPPEEAAVELARIERALATPIDGPPGERLLVERLDLSPLERDALWLLAAPEVEPRFQWLVDRLYGARTDGAVTRAFLRHLLGASPESDAALSPDGPLARYALLVAADGSRVRIAPRVLDLLLGHDGTRDLGLVGLARRLPVAATEPALTSRTAAALERLGAVGARRLLLTGAEGTGFVEVAHALARRHGCAEVLEVDTRALADAGPDAAGVLLREALLGGGLLLFRHAGTLESDRLSLTGRAAVVEALRRENVPLVFDGGTIESLQVLLTFGATLGASHLELDLAPPGERAALWERVLAAAGVEGEAVRPLVDASRAFPIGVDHMAEAVRLARASSDGLAADALRAACDRLVTHRLGEYAVKVKARARWEDFVVPNDVGEQVVDFIYHARLSRHVLDELGYGKRLAYGRGLSALLSGPSGTGKTMAATLIADHLGVELYRVDLASIVSKYIGETEERIANVFREAAATGAALLFDEADSLFAKRTEVKSSNDRYANLEVNFLLQKLEEHDGISLLTTNFAGSIDKAFLRRIRFHIDFPEPDEAAREQLWAAMIPDGAPRDADIDLRALAKRYPMAGGAIRNAVLRAAFRAAADQRPLAQRDLEAAARAEVTAMGKLEWEPP